MAAHKLLVLAKKLYLFPTWDSQGGFTLIESLVSVVLFATVVVSILGTYLYTIKLSRRTDEIRSISENSRFISEFITKEIRNGQIDYSPPSTNCSGRPPYANPDTAIAILNIDGDHECFYAVGVDLFLQKTLVNGLSLAPVKLNSPNVAIDQFAVFVSPANINPYTSGSTLQPTLTVTAMVRSLLSQDNIKVPLDLSVTIPKYDF